MASWPPVLPSLTFFHSPFYNFLPNPLLELTLKTASSLSLCLRVKSVLSPAQAVCGFNVCPVVVPSSVFASGNLGVDFLGFCRYTATSDAKCDQASYCVGSSMHLCIYLISFFLSNHPYFFCKGNEEQLGYIECRLALEIYPFLIF